MNDIGRDDPMVYNELFARAFVAPYRKTTVTRLFNRAMRTFHMSFMLHVEFQGE